MYLNIQSFLLILNSIHLSLCSLGRFSILVGNFKESWGSIEAPLHVVLSDYSKLREQIVKFIMGCGFGNILNNNIIVRFASQIILLFLSQLEFSYLSIIFSFIFRKMFIFFQNIFEFVLNIAIPQIQV